MPAPANSRSAVADVIVLGAGMAGVTAARRLKSAGLDVMLLEARRRIGGRICTLRDICDAPVEAGAELIHGARAQTWPDVRAAGLTVRPNSHGISAMMVDLGDGGQWLPLALLHPQTWAAFGVLRRVRAPQARDVTAQEFIERCGYRGRARQLAEMVFTSHVPGRLEEIGINGFLDDGALELETSADYRVNEGYDKLVEHIGCGLDVEFGFEVREIEWSADGVALHDAQGRTHSARAVISTVPGGVLQSKAIRFTPELPESKRTALQQIVMGPVIKLIMRFDEPFWPRRLSTLVSATGPVTLYWNVFYKATLAFPLLTAYCTGPRAAALSECGEDEVVALVVADLRRHFPRSKPRLLAWRLVDWSRDPFARGGYTFLRQGAADARARLAASDTGRLFWAGSETATEPIAATVGGAFSSGLRAAREVLCSIRA
jgi:monoamine oxidase